MEPGQPLADRLRDALLVARVEVREEQADGDGLDPRGRYLARDPVSLGIVERLDHPRGRFARARRPRPRGRQAASAWLRRADRERPSWRPISSRSSKPSVATSAVRAPALLKERVGANGQSVDEV